MMMAIKVPVTIVQSVLVESIQSLISNLFFFMPMPEWGHAKEALL